jgi:alpha-lytic endopeptidase
MSSNKVRYGKSLLALACIAVSFSTCAGSRFSSADMDDAQAEAIDSSVSPEMLAALARDLAISEAQLPQYQAVERQASEAEAAAKASLGDRYGGTWIERGSDGLFYTVVASTDVSVDVPVANVVIRKAQFSLAQLDDAMGMLNGALSTLRNSRSNPVDLDGLHTWYVDVQSNDVVLTVAKGYEDTAYNLVALSGADAKLIRIERSQGKPSPAISRAVYGGREYGTGNGLCSIGFAVTRGATKGFVTAGHCGTARANVSISGENVGTVQGSSFPTNDYGWANVRSEDKLRSFVFRYNGNKVVNIVGSTEATSGASICRSGFASGYRCGTVGSKNVTVNYPDGAVFQLTQSNACLTQGDSGGSWITPGGQAQGVSSGGGLDNSSPATNCSFSDPASYFQKVNEILSAYGLSLIRSP